jgi:alkylation response protein AidB-like acyl-CoA dehydrogenase
MDFRLTSEQQMLRDSVAAALARVADGGWGKAFAEAGVLGILVPESDGGLGLGMVEASLVAQEAGFRNAVWPIAETLAALPLLARTCPEEAAVVLAGTKAISATVASTASPRQGRLRREIKFPFWPDLVRVAVPLAEGRVALVKPDAETATAEMQVDLSARNMRMAIDSPATGETIVEAPPFAPRLALLRAAEIAGAARFCFETAVQYLKDRSQFGRPIGANQALKHMAADDFVRLANIRVALDYACAAHDRSVAAPDDREAADEARRAVQVVMAYVPEAARGIAENAMQMHGGIGVTWDYALNAPVRRILRVGAALGAPQAHRRALGRSLAEGQIAPGFDTAAE